jgi:hypothetical protein
MNILCKWVFIIIFLISPFSAYAVDKRYNVPIGDSSALGPVNAPITMIEFIDYQ